MPSARSARLSSRSVGRAATQITEGNDFRLNYRVEEWKKFKVKLFDIYEHRIKHAMEISGTINTASLTLEEHLLIYFIEKHSLSSRLDIEKKVLEFVITLRSHAEYGWERARMFAQLYGFFQPSVHKQSGISRKRTTKIIPGA